MDTSDVAVGGILTQEGKVIEYLSHALSPAEKKFSTRDKEFFGVRLCLKHWRHYLLFAETTVITDHENNSRLTSPTPSSQYMKMADAVAEFNLRFVYKPGRYHHGPDGLSRRVVNEESLRIPHGYDDEETHRPVMDRELKVKCNDVIRYENDSDSSQVAAVTTRSKTKAKAVPDVPVTTQPATTVAAPTITVPLDQEQQSNSTPQDAPMNNVPDAATRSPTPTTATTVPATPNEMPLSFAPLLSDDVRIVLKEEAYLKDRAFAKVYKHLLNGTAAPDIGGFKLELREYVLEDGLLYKKNPTDPTITQRLCIPDCPFKTQLLKHAHEHEAAHLSRDRSAELLARKFYWVNLNADVKRFVTSCLICQRSKPFNANAVAPLTPLPVPTRPWQFVNMDFFNLPECEGHNRVLLVVDRFSKMIVLIPTVTTLDATGAAKLFLNHVAYRFGFPDTLTGDRDVLWTSQVFKELMSFFKIKLKLTTVSRPQSDGQAERSIQSVMNLL